MKKLFVFCAVSLFLCGEAFAQYTYQSVAYLGGDLTRLLGINNQGEVAGAYRITPPRHAVLYSRGAFQALDPAGVLGADFSEAWAVNERGDVVGRYLDDFGNEHGFLYQGGSLITLDVPFPSIQTDAYDINASGDVVGGFADPQGFVHGFLYSKGVYKQIDYPGAVDTLPLGINARGDVVGDWDTDPTTLGHGFVLSHGSFATFDHPNAAPYSTYFVGISDNGSMSGLYLDATGALHNFVKSKKSLTELLVPGADAMNTVGHINASGQVVGTYISHGQQTGYVATPAKKGK